MDSVTQDNEKLKKQNHIYEKENVKLNDQITSMLTKDTDTSVHILNLNKNVG